ncbi:MAG TPA: hypothetical protein VFP97_06635, partial [Chitinophagaceae bacterium]|nr:hypothetical protein [Chitinophagaceae bacterium]
MKQFLLTIAFNRYVLVAMAIAIFSINSPGQSKTGYAQVNGLKMYYEVHGSGKPIVLLHGAFNTINMAFGQLIP